MDDLWLLYFTLGFFGYLSTYAVRWPASAEIFKVNLLSLIEFRELNPVKLYSRLDKKFNMDLVIANLSKTWADIYEQFMIVIIIASALFIMIVSLGFLYLFPRLKPKVKEKTIKLKE